MSEKMSEKFIRGELLNVNCPSRDVLKRVTSRWSVLILLALQDQTLRFSALRRTVGGVSERMLAQNLRYLEEDGFVQRIAYDVVPPHVEYRLTPLGREVGEQVVGLADWLELNLSRILAQREKFAAE
ncbi:winged helix-turn-helix transcriptional regulator [Pantoea agglomerans]|jgi:DNA-binding HxlR family transcriptional regulator|uniref:Helix-turn-helix transcriptional regulator n=1 Tax=Enterobacter agglomerans TaxID=549 RepID=A0ACC5PKT0_ENTAG|nr:helix-turn-helix domain-containing protein [Pantoea agglomerans]MBD8125671.1 helix-turn-helix transcriptional regulator [Pantoea agglomerans]MBD8153098.1 helix-turn-helix transcriptional regulator [Pantoea agglomerans]MBD8242409.1 helix-turn-helix transcriptional regulator [Pantoea agglomerans]UOV18909.1 helix-turn-helix transcriptional regulator [Pantoea agglomerans]WVL86344.1 helix-turn-helix domain-containing protein [Pantoea agglomerans]